LNSNLLILQPLEYHIYENVVYTDRTKYLEFEVVAEQIAEEGIYAGWLITFRPLMDSMFVVKKKYHHLVKHFGEKTYVQYLQNQDIKDQ
jgi:hypothetical protein